MAQDFDGRRGFAEWRRGLHRNEAPRTAVYSAEGLYAGERVGDEIQWADARVWAIIDGHVYDEAGDCRYVISDAWWYSPENVGKFYQNDVIPDDWEETLKRDELERVLGEARGQ